MKTKCIVLLILILLVLPSCSVNQTGFAGGLMDQTKSTDMEQLTKDIQAMYQTNISEMLIINKPIFLLTLISDADIRNASLSEPIPIFISGEKYKKGDDYKSKLKLAGWDIIVYSSGHPIAVFSIGKLMGEYVYHYTKGEEYAILFTEALDRIDRDTALVLPLGSHDFLADGTDTVVPLLTLNEITGEVFPTRSFKEFNAAVNISIDYYSEIDPEDIEIGGNKVLLDALYGE